MDQQDPDFQAEPHPTELIVDLRHRDAVLALLADLRVPHDGVEDSADLRLTLLRNLDMAAYAPGARKDYANELAAANPDGFTDLDVLLHDLRHRFATDHGHLPVLGKNREAIVGFPQHKGLPKTPVAVSEPLTITKTGRGAGVRIGVVDTPVVPHSALPADLVAVDAALTAPASEQFWAGHGTFVAGLIRQAAPDAHLDMRTGLSAVNGKGDSWELAKTIAAFRHSGIHILNLSLGCATADGNPPLVLSRAVEVLGDEVLVVAAAGNRNLTEDRLKAIWPAAATAVVAVGATQRPGGESAFSMDRPWVDCVAPGVRVISAYPTRSVLGEGESDDGWAMWSGTSFAAATVSGEIAARMTKNHCGAKEARENLLHDETSVVRKFEFHA
jgi:subtilisin family serine protease